MSWVGKEKGSSGGVAEAGGVWVAAVGTVSELLTDTRFQAGHRPRAHHPATQP